MKTLYKGHIIEGPDHTGNFLAIDGVQYVREWHNTNVDDGLQFAKNWIDSEFQHVCKNARPLNESDWGSERQMFFENQIAGYLDKILTDGQKDRFEIWALKATTDEIIDEALKLWSAAE